MDDFCYDIIFPACYSAERNPIPCLKVHDTVLTVSALLPVGSSFFCQEGFFSSMDSIVYLANCITDIQHLPSVPPGIRY